MQKGPSVFCQSPAGELVKLGLPSATLFSYIMPEADPHSYKPVSLLQVLPGVLASASVKPWIATALKVLYIWPISTCTQIPHSASNHRLHTECDPTPSPTSPLKQKTGAVGGGHCAWQSASYPRWSLRWVSLSIQLIGITGMVLSPLFLYVH